MALFKLTSYDSKIVLLVFAKCITCARNLAADCAGAEGTAIWRNPAKSTVEVLREPHAAQIIIRSEKA